MTKKVTLDMIREAREAMKDVAELTPIVTSRQLGENLVIKSENLQKTGSFKIRGAFNKIRTLSETDAAKGVIACSAGNHAQGVALSASRLGIRSIICMPARLASRMRADSGAGMVPLPGRAMPMASVRQFMELAVYMPEQEPQVGQALSSYSSTPSSSSLPA